MLSGAGLTAHVWKFTRPFTSDIFHVIYIYTLVVVVVVVYNCIIFDIVFHHNSICILIMIIYDYCISTYACRWHGTLQNVFLVLVLTHPPILKFDPNTLW